MGIIIALLVILIVAMIAFYIVRQLPLEPGLKNIILVVVGVIILIALLSQLLPLAGIDTGLTLR